MANFEYYYGTEAEQFNFFRLPKKLVRDKKFNSVSAEAKILYGAMMDRMALSIRNGWVDAENRVYIIFTVADVAEEFNCSERKAKMLMNELDTTHGICLIEKKRRGLGKPNLIYVKNFNSEETEEIEEKYVCMDEEEPESTYQQPDPEELCREEPETVWSEYDQSGHERTGTDQREDLRNTLCVQEGETQPFQKCKNMHVQRCKTVHVKKCKNVHVQRCKNVHPSNTDLSETDNNYNNLSIHPSDNQELDTSDGWMDRDIVLYTLRKKLGYDTLLLDNPQRRDRIEELFCLMADACCYTGETMTIGGNTVPVRDIRARFMQQLTLEHIRYVLNSLDQVTTKVRNIRAYMLACLYNAPATMASFYRVEMMHDIGT